ncbi:hypothetical protein JOB18_027117 [Solea senegalensis]|uniref:Uncharacterized protein n=1 Tax=Solea senegalensis TaxID=28829 RepID=A0AAV6QFG0_SOLSE|nr:hypothetical protein JOB18_027117 [Solea senegalensis]
MTTSSDLRPLSSVLMSVIEKRRRIIGVTDKSLTFHRRSRGARCKNHEPRRVFSLSDGQCSTAADPQQEKMKKPPAVSSHFILLLLAAAASESLYIIVQQNTAKL